ncbi:MAG: hypothetical protein JXR96_04425 [Deltaproteobacteria bacterium]|nr:hypothetical protein [Deltaproteobacteria bacterium]
MPPNPDLPSLARKWHASSPFSTERRSLVRKIGPALADPEPEARCRAAIACSPGSELRVEALLRGGVEARREAVELLASIPVYDMVSDRDERDIGADIPLLAVCLQDPDPAVRRGAASALDAARSDRQDVSLAIPAAMAVLGQARRTDIHRACALLLRDQVTDDRSPLDLRPLLPELTRLLASPSQDVKLGVADALAYFHARKKHIPALRALLAHADKDVRQETLGTLERVPRSAGLALLLPDIAGRLQDEDEEVRLVTVRALRRHGMQRALLEPAVRVLVDLARHPSARLRKNACWEASRLVRACFSCHSPLPRDDWPVLDPLVAMLEKTLRRGTREKAGVAAKALLQHRKHVDRWPQVAELLEALPASLMQNLISDLDSCGELMTCELDRTPVIPLLADLLPGARGELRRALIWQLEDYAGCGSEAAERVEGELARIGKAAQAADLDGLHRRIWDRVHRKTLEALAGELKGARGQARLRRLARLLRDERLVARRWAAEQLAEVWEGCGRPGIAIDALTRALEDRDAEVRALGARALGRAASGQGREKPRSIASAVPALAGKLADPDAGVRAEAALALKHAAEHGEEIAVAIGPLGRVLGSKGALERYRAASALWQAARSGQDIAAAAGALMAASRGGERELRQTAVQALGWYLQRAPGSAAERRHLLRFLSRTMRHNPCSNARASAASAFEDLAKAGEDLQAYVSALCEAVADRDLTVRKLAIGALVEQLVHHHRARPHDRGSRTALAVDALRQAYRRVRGIEIKRVASKALLRIAEAGIDISRAVPDLARALDPAFEKRIDASGFYDKTAHQGPVAALVAFLEQGRPLAGKRAQAVLDCLHQAARRGESPGVQQTAARGLEILRQRGLPA